MSSYVQSYAGDAAAELAQFIRQSGLTPDEIAYCVAELSDAARLARGVSKQLLVRLRDESQPLLRALATANEARLRLFAIETANHNTSQAYGYRPKPLARLIADVPQLLDDLDEDVRLAAASSSGWMWSNVGFIEAKVHQESEHIVLRLYRKFLALLDDPSAKVRMAAAIALGDWASKVARQSLLSRLEREADPSVREALAAAIGTSSEEL
jgi:HEAT repeat protein